MRIPGFQFYTLLLVTFSAVSVLADDKVETVLEALINPCGVAVQPETGIGGGLRRTSADGAGGL